MAHEQGRAPTSFPPDVVLRLRADDPALLPVDAKYKRYDAERVSAGDIHQLLTYAHAFRPAGGTPRAIIVHPAGAGTARRDVTVRGPAGPLGIIDVVGLDVSQPPRECVTELTRALTATAQKPRIRVV